jgi:hypothetical protein
MKKNPQTLIDASKEVGIEVTVEKTNYMLICHHHNARTHNDIKTVIRVFENMAQFKYLGMSVMNQN